MTTTELQTLETMNFEQLALFTGANVRPPAIILPRLKVNTEPLDDEGKALPMGHFMVTVDNVTHYSPKAIFRPYIQGYQYNEYSPAEKKFVNRSIIIKNFGEEALDEKGGLACGKISAKELPNCSAQEQLRQKNVKCRRYLYGLVSFPKEVSNLPVILQLQGSNFMAPKDALDSITKIKHQFFQHQMELTTNREKQGATTYYTISFNVDLKNTIQMADKDMDTIRVFKEVIDRENSFVLKAWENAKREAVKSLDDPMKLLDLNDDIFDIGE